MQQVLHYSALKTGTAYVALTLTTIAFSGVAQALTTRGGVLALLMIETQPPVVQEVPVEDEVELEAA